MFDVQSSRFKVQGSRLECGAVEEGQDAEAEEEMFEEEFSACEATIYFDLSKRKVSFYEQGGNSFGSHAIEQDMEFVFIIYGNSF